MAIIKSKKEIKYIQEACQITDAIFKIIINNFYFKTEKQLCNFISHEIRARGLRPAFPPIVSSGPRAGNEIHPKPTDAQLSGFVIIDFGVRVNGYCSDMTRTIYVGRPNRQERQQYSLLKKVQEKALKKVFPESPVSVPDVAARKELGKYAKYFIHTLGHGVGRRIHELPRIYKKNLKDVFKKGMVVTIEPGIYLPQKRGLRIEDTLLVKEKGIHIFTKSKKELIIFPPVI